MAGMVCMLNIIWVAILTLCACLGIHACWYNYGIGSMVLGMCCGGTTAAAGTVPISLCAHSQACWVLLLCLGKLCVWYNCCSKRHANPMCVGRTAHAHAGAHVGGYPGGGG